MKTEISKLLIASIAVSFVVHFVGADSETANLRSRISALESSISDIIQEIKRKDVTISKIKMLAEKKSEKIDSLQREIDWVQKNAASDVKVAMEKSRSQFSELEKQVNRLKSSIKEQAAMRASLETQVNEADKKEQELVLKLESIQKSYDEQKHRVRKTQYALQEAEEELMKAQLEAASKSEKLIETLVPTTKEKVWRYASLVQSYGPIIFAKTIEIYRVSMESIANLELAFLHFQFKEAKKISKIYIDQIAILAKPCIEKLLLVLNSCHKYALHSFKKFVTTSTSSHDQKKLFLTTKEKIWRYASWLQSYAQVIFTKTIEVYRVTKERITNLIVRECELAGPYFLFQEAKEISKPYIDQIANLAKPHIEKLLLVLSSCNAHAVHSFKKFVTTVTSCHDQVRASIHENLEKYEQTKPFAAAELEWFLALALLALPMFFLCKLLRTCFC